MNLSARFFQLSNLTLYRKVLGLALIVLCLGGIGTGVALVENSALTTVETMNRARTAIACASRYELAFIARRDSAFADSARTQLAALEGILLSSHKTDAEDSLLQSLSAHISLFATVESKLRERGLDENSGSEGALRKSVHAIEGIVKQASMDKLQVIMLSMRRSEKDFLLREKSKYIEKVAQETDKLIARTKEADLPDSIKQSITMLAGNYLRDFNRAAGHIQEVTALSDSLATSAAAIDQRIAVLAQEDKQRADALHTVMLAAIVLSVCGSVLLAVRMSRSITRPIQELQQAASAVAAGKLDAHIATHNSDELGELSETFNSMTAQLRRSDEEKRRYLAESIEELLDAMDRFAKGDLSVHLDANNNDDVGKLYNGFNTAVDAMRDTLRHVVATIATTASASAKITDATGRMTDDAVHQKEQIGHVASTVEQLAASSADNAHTAERAAELAHEYRATAQDGAAVIRQTVEKIGSIATVVRTSMQTIRNLNNSRARISEIIDVINEIADQTNMLALNAAIEAARAGAHGRGFSVVADEVGKLAVRTSTATKNIASMIRSIQTEAETAVDAMRYGEQEVGEGIALADRAGAALASIMGTSGETLYIVADITNASKEQSKATASIARSLDDIRTTTAHTAATLADIGHSAEELHNLTENLQLLVRKFDIQHDNHDHKAVRARIHIHREHTLLHPHPPVPTLAAQRYDAEHSNQQ